MASACSIVLARDPSSMMGGMYPTSDRLGSRASSCILMSVAVVCVCVMVVCGVFVLREYTLAQNYRESSCRLSNITYSGDVGCTHCSGVKETNREKGSGGGGSCAPSQLPCLHVVVSYRYNGTFFRTAMLYENSVQAVGAHSQCSFFVCLKTRDENQRAVDEYADRWRSTHSSKFPCYYDADDQDKVIAHKTYTRWDVIHSMLWPSLVLVLCGALFLHLEARRRGLTFCGRKDEEKAASAGESAAKESQHHHHHGNVVNFTASGSDKFNGSPSRDSLLQGDVAGTRRGRGDVRLSKLSSSLSSLEKMSTRPSASRASPPIARLGTGYTGVEKMLKRKTASVDRLADVRVKQQDAAGGRRYAANIS